MRKSRRQTRKRRGGVRKNLSPEELNDLRAVIIYEQFNKRNMYMSPKTGKPMNILTIQQRIQSILDKQEPLKEEKIVWRGHFRGNTIQPDSWFSTSELRDISHSYGSRHLFKIHLQPGTKCLDLYKFYSKYNITNPYNETNYLRNLFNNATYEPLDNYLTFREIIVDSGGSFWQDKAKTKPGFKITKKEQYGMLNENNPEPYLYEYDTYYFPKD